MRMWTAAIVFLLLQTAIVAQEPDPVLSLVPRPASVQRVKGTFSLNDRTRIAADLTEPTTADAAQELRDRLRRSTGYPLRVISPQEAANGDIVLRATTGSRGGAESYTLSVDAVGVMIDGGGRSGLFHGIETFLQLFSPEVFSVNIVKKKEWVAQSVKIEDGPRFSWRGMHLDVSRHFFPKEFIYTYIDMLAMHKFNVFHWHLIDDQGWRIEIKKWPRLTDVGAWRVDREHEHWNARAPQGPDDTATYGGFYTQEEIRDIVAYASARNIMVVPEIEMPAHVTCALAAYPQFSCTGGPFTVPPGGVWPITDIYCAGNDSTFLFLEDVLTEVMDLFPGPYIHIGGDEATKDEWERCPKCQERIRREGLRNEAELQSYFIRRIETFLISKGRKLIGWDEILEGGLAPEATVMSWRGVAGGIAAVRSGHDAVMTPTSHCYFNYFQGLEDTEPIAGGGYIPLSAVFNYEPVPDGLSETEAEHILGAQANVWTEFIATPAHVQYMTLPRMAAMAEVVWSPKEGKEWNDFVRRVAVHLRRYEARGYTYARSAYGVNYALAFDSSRAALAVTMSNELGVPGIRYELSGKDPGPASALYTQPIVVDRSTTFRAATFSGGQMKSGVSVRDVMVHKALMKPVTYGIRPTRYTAAGDDALVDGLRGRFIRADDRWQGVRGSDFDVTIDLGVSEAVNSISVSHLQNTLAWIFFPKRVEFYAGADTSEMRRVAVFERPMAERHDGPTVLEFRQAFHGLSARFVRVRAVNAGVCPEWHMGVGQQTWVFMDEVVVE